MDFTPETQQKPHLFSKIDDIDVDLLFLQPLGQFHQLQGEDVVALARLSALNRARLSTNQSVLGAPIPKSVSPLSSPPSNRVLRYFTSLGGTGAQCPGWHKGNAPAKASDRPQQWGQHPRTPENGHFQPVLSRRARIILHQSHLCCFKFILQRS